MLSNMVLKIVSERFMFINNFLELIYKQFDWSKLDDL